LEKTRKKSAPEIREIHTSNGLYQKKLVIKPSDLMIEVVSQLIN
jgi:hypothetical protein